MIPASSLDDACRILSDEFEIPFHGECEINTANKAELAFELDDDSAGQILVWERQCPDNSTQCVPVFQTKAGWVISLDPEFTCSDGMFLDRDTLSFDRVEHPEGGELIRLKGEYTSQTRGLDKDVASPERVTFCRRFSDQELQCTTQFMTACLGDEGYCGEGVDDEGWELRHRLDTGALIIDGDRLAPLGASHKAKALVGAWTLGKRVARSEAERKFVHHWDAWQSWLKKPFGEAEARALCGLDAENWLSSHLFRHHFFRLPAPKGVSADAWSDVTHALSLHLELLTGTCEGPDSITPLPLQVDNVIEEFKAIRTLTLAVKSMLQPS